MKALWIIVLVVLPKLLYSAALDWSLGPISLGMRLSDTETFLRVNAADVGCKVIALSKSDKLLEPIAFDASAEFVFVPSNVGIWELVEIAVEYESSTLIESNLRLLFGNPNKESKEEVRWVKGGKTLIMQRGSPALLQFKLNGYRCPTNQDTSKSTEDGIHSLKPTY